MALRPLFKHTLIKPALSRSFHASRAAYIKVGDGLPELPDALMEDSPGNKINLAKELFKDKGLIIGVPAAFSPSCSAKHIPGYMQHPKLASAGKVFVLSVNDAFVMKAWADGLDPEKKSGIRFLADPSAAYTSALEMEFENIPIFGGTRSVRYALEVEDGKVKAVHVEPDKTGVNVSSAENVLG